MQAPESITQSTVKIPVEQHLFDEALHLTGITEYGVSFEDFLSGQVEIPAHGARFDIAYEGAIEGERLRGYIKGVDYLVVRGDGRFQLNIYATLTTDDGARIAVTSDALLKTPDPATGVAELRLNMTFSTAFPDYAWVNDIHAWGIGTVNMQTREVSASLYEA